MTNLSAGWVRLELTESNRTFPFAMCGVWILRLDCYLEKEEIQHQLCYSFFSNYYFNYFIILVLLVIIILLFLHWFF